MYKFSRFLLSLEALTGVSFFLQHRSGKSPLEAPRLSAPRYVSQKRTKPAPKLIPPLTFTGTCCCHEGAREKGSFLFVDWRLEILFLNNLLSNSFESYYSNKQEKRTHPAARTKRLVVDSNSKIYKCEQHCTIK